MSCRHWKLGMASRADEDCPYCRLAAANERINLLKHDMKSGDYETLYAQTVHELAAEHAVSGRLLEALKMVADDLGYIAFKCGRDTITLQPARTLIAEVEAIRKEQK